MVKRFLFIRPCTLTFVLLIALTLVTYFIGISGASGIGISLTVLGFALLKGQLIGDHFMGLSHVAGFWRWVIFAWLFIPGGLIATAFYISV